MDASVPKPKAGSTATIASTNAASASATTAAAITAAASANANAIIERDWVCGLAALHTRPIHERGTIALTGAQLEAYRSWAGDGVFRLSVGLEDPKDLIKDLDRALS